MSTTLTAQDMGRELYDDESGNFRAVIDRMAGDRRKVVRSDSADRRAS